MILAIMSLAAQVSFNNAVTRSAQLASAIPCSNNIVLLDFDAGTDGQALSSTLLSNSTHGGALIFTNDLPGDSGFASAGQYNLQNYIYSCGNGTFTGNGLVGFRCGCSSNIGFQITFPSSTPKLSWGYWFHSTFEGNQIIFIDSMASGSTLGTQDYLNISMESGADAAHFRFGMEHHGGHPESQRVFLTNTVYWITAVQDTTAGQNYQLSIYDNANPPNLITNLSDSHEVGAGNIEFVRMGYRISGQTSTTANLYWDNIKFNTNGTFPIMP